MTSSRVLPLGAEEFLARALPALLEREAENNLMLGLARYLATNAARAVQALLLALEADGAVVGAALRIPPHDLVVTRLPEGGAALIAQHVAALPEPITGVAGPEGAGFDVAQCLTQRLGLEVRPRVRRGYATSRWRSWRARCLLRVSASLACSPTQPTPRPITSTRASVLSGCAGSTLTPCRAPG